MGSELHTESALKSDPDPSKRHRRAAVVVVIIIIMTTTTTAAIDSKTGPDIFFPREFGRIFSPRELGRIWKMGLRKHVKIYPQ